jgi:hypothetical protein
MKLLKLPITWLWLAAFFALPCAIAQSPIVINEILFNPPNVDTPNEYIEFRGQPSYFIPPGTYFVAVDGDFSTDTNPGVIENVFDLSGRKLGTNGVLVLLQKGNIYAVNPNATAVVNTGSGAGWGDGATSSIGHRGKSELDNASVTFFLIRTSFPPEPDDDIDANNDGLPDGPYQNWTVIDSVGVLDATGPGDFAYGAINYRRNTPPGNQAGALGVVVGVGFTAVYVGRSANTTASLDTAWVASNNLNGTMPNWALPDSANVWPQNFATRALNHIGSPNFGAAALRGLVITHSDGRTEVPEGAGSTDSYTVGLNAVPTGNVVVQVTAPTPVQVSIDGGATFFPSRTLTFNSMTPQTVVVRAIDDNLVDASPYVRNIIHDIVSTADPTKFPESLILASTPVFVIENDWLLLNEIKVNPPGTSDAPHEFIEIRGSPNATLTNVQFVALEGDDGGDPGTVTFAFDLTSQRLGANGLMLLAAPGHGYSVSASTPVLTLPVLGTPGGVLGNGSASFLLVSGEGSISMGADLDAGDNGIAEGLPLGATILDAVGWRDGNTSDIVYGGVMLVDGDTPDAAVRFRGNNTPRSPDAWYFGDLDGTDSSSVVFKADDVSDNFPAGTNLTPGGSNPAYFTTIPPIAGAIGDPTNPKVFFAARGFSGSANVTVMSTNQAVVPDSNLVLTALGGGQYSLALDPVGVGYSLINLTASDGVSTARASFRYAASERGDTDTRYHTFASDASTAIPIDSDYMFIGDDENQVIRIYRRKESGDPLVGFDITPFLGLTDYENGRPREVDIEASTRVGNRIFWIGAHSHANIAEGRTNRSRIFATDVSGTGLASTLTYVGRYDYLKLDLVNWDVNNLHGKGANYYGLAASTAEGVNPKEPDGSGFNIEGLTMGLNSNVGYIGFRAPIVPTTNRTHALIVPVLNFASVAISAGPPGSAVFGAPIELDLYGRGIRSMECVDENYLIVAGIPGDFIGEYPNDFRLYTWTGNPADKPQERATDLSGLNPEGIVELPQPPWTPNSLVHLVSDAGRKIWYNDAITAKEMSIPTFKKFRTDIVSLGSVVKTTPKVTFMRYRAGGFTIGWRSVAGERYRVEYKSSFSDAGWTQLGNDVVAIGTFASVTDPTPSPPHRFYHVLVVP